MTKNKACQNWMQTLKINDSLDLYEDGWKMWLSGKAP